MNEVLVDCKVQKGMFSSEVEVEISFKECIVKTLCSKKLVKDGKIRLRVLEKDFLVIPGDIIEGSRLVKI